MLKKFGIVKCSPELDQQEMRRQYKEQKRNVIKECFKKLYKAILNDRFLWF